MSRRFGDVLKSIRIKREMSQDDFADLLGTTKQVVSRYENNQRSPKITTVQEYAEILRVPLFVLLGESDDPELNPGYDPSDILSNVTPQPKANTVALVGRIACGSPIWADQNVEEYIPVPAHCKADFALRCQGDSMTGARIFDGDIVYIRRQPDVDNGEIAAVLVDEEATLKKVYRTPEKLVLRPENPMYSDKVFAGDEMNEVTILGKAVCFVSMVQHEVDRVDGEWRKYIGQPTAARGGGVKPMTEAQAKTAWKYEQQRIKTGSK